MPTSPAFVSSDWGISRNVAISESPFTGSTQVHKYSKDQWTATLTLPPMRRELARQWQAFFMNCVGRANTFLLGDPDGKTVTGGAVPLSVTVSADGAIGDTSVSLTIGSGKKINAGSYLQFGSNANAKLHMVVDDNTGDGAVTIEPPLKADISSSDVVTFISAKGVFRMDTNALNWTADNLGIYGITFSCSEAL